MPTRVAISTRLIAGGGCGGVGCLLPPSSHRSEGPPDQPAHRGRAERRQAICHDGKQSTQQRSETRWRHHRSAHHFVPMPMLIGLARMAAQLPRSGPPTGPQALTMAARVRPLMPRRQRRDRLDAVSAGGRYFKPLRCKELPCQLPNVEPSRRWNCGRPRLSFSLVEPRQGC
jgi:hypothetical protein